MIEDTMNTKTVRNNVFTAAYISSCEDLQLKHPTALPRSDDGAVCCGWTVSERTYCIFLGTSLICVAL